MNKNKNSAIQELEERLAYRPYFKIMCICGLGESARYKSPYYCYYYYYYYQCISMNERLELLQYSTPEHCIDGNRCIYKSPNVNSNPNSFLLFLAPTFAYFPSS